MQTLHAGCSKMEPKKFAPLQTPFPEVRDGQNLISWRWGHYLYLQTQSGEDWCMQFLSYRGNRPTHKHCPPQTGPITIHCTAKLSAQCNETYYERGETTKSCMFHRPAHFSSQWHPPTVTASLHTDAYCTIRRSQWGLPSSLWTQKAPGCTVGRQASHQPTVAVPCYHIFNFR